MIYIGSTCWPDTPGECSYNLQIRRIETCEHFRYNSLKKLVKKNLKFHFFKENGLNL